MSRRTRTFLIGLLILAIPLLLVLVTPIVQRINATPDTEQVVENTVEARLTQIAQGTPTSAIETRVEATLTAIALPTAPPRSGVEGTIDSVVGFAQSSPILACCVGVLILLVALYFFSVAKYGE